MKWIILFPFLPLKWAWQWSADSEVNGKKSGFAHVGGFVVVAIILYSIIGAGISQILSLCGAK